MRKRTHSINVCVCELVFESLHANGTFTKRKSVNKQRDKACKQNINQILLDLDSLGFESFEFGILNCPSLVFSLSLCRNGDHKETFYWVQTTLKLT